MLKLFYTRRLPLSRIVAGARLPLPFHLLVLERPIGFQFVENQLHCFLLDHVAHG